MKEAYRVCVPVVTTPKSSLYKTDQADALRREGGLGLSLTQDVEAEKAQRTVLTPFPVDQNLKLLCQIQATGSNPAWI